MTNLPRRDIAFLERTAKAVPDRNVSRCGVAVCFGSYAQAFMYCERYDGGSMTRITREQAEAMLAARQS